MSRSEIGNNWIPIDADDFDNPKKRAIIENAMTKQRNSKNNNSTINKGSLAYMSKDNRNILIKNYKINCLTLLVLVDLMLFLV